MNNEGVKKESRTVGKSSFKKIRKLINHLR